MRRGLLLTAALLAMPASAIAPPGEPPRHAKPPIVVISPAEGNRSVAGNASKRPVPIISLSVKDADLVEVVRSLARIASVNVIFDPGVSGKVTAELIEVRWDHALAVILKTQGLGMELDGRVLTVAAPARLVGVE